MFSLFFFNDTATTEIYTLSLHDALPISRCGQTWGGRRRRPSGRSGTDPGVTATVIARDCAARAAPEPARGRATPIRRPIRSEEHTSELQSPCNLVCRLLLEKKKKQTQTQGNRKTMVARACSRPQAREAHPTAMPLTCRASCSHGDVLLPWQGPRRGHTAITS